ncbi:hypothetical protein LCGC14_0842330 [marine sediment metagenome]|uniref:Carboxypeptidase regulatory-like domain-containing protein n=1 Tax=marine sediment metagenome TaxID=412755 RepID=A0A0F9PHH1_9ZZZZ
MTTRVALLAAILLMAIAPQALASTRVHGIVQDDAYQGVAGGHIRIEHLYDGHWYIEYEDRAMQGHSFGWDLTKDGTYRVSWSMPGYRVVGEIKHGEFTLPGGAPAGDIVVNVIADTTATPTPWPTLPVPTTLFPPTVDPTATATATPAGWTAPYAVVSWYGNWGYGTDALKSQAPGPGFMQLSEMWQWAIIDKARQMQGAPLESLLDVRDDPLWLNGADMGLGSQETPRFEVGPYEAMGFAQAIVVRER